MHDLLLNLSFFLPLIVPILISRTIPERFMTILTLTPWAALFFVFAIGFWATGENAAIGAVAVGGCLFVPATILTSLSAINRLKTTAFRLIALLPAFLSIPVLILAINLGTTPTPVQSFLQTNIYETVLNASYP